MRAVVQRVSKAEVRVDDEAVGKIGQGLLVLFCAEPQDTEKDVDFFAQKISKMRIFHDENQKMNLSVLDIGGAVLAISQFTLAAEWRKGNRPGFSGAAAPELGEALYNRFCMSLGETGVPVETGRFGAEMAVDFINDGPVTIIMDSEK